MIQRCHKDSHTLHCFHYVQDWDAYTQRMKAQSPSYYKRYPVLAATKLLGALGFVFCGAESCGGDRDVAHGGIDSYSVTYSDFQKFEQCFDEDLQQADLKVWKETGGWVSTLSYDGTKGYFKKDNIRITVFCDNQDVLLHILDCDHSLDPRKTAEQLRSELGPASTIDAYTADASLIEIFLKHWHHAK